MDHETLVFSTVPREAAGGVAGGRPGLGVTTTRIGGALGAVVDGMDLCAPADDERWEVVRESLVEHQVLFFPRQPLTETQQLAVASRFGTPSVYPMQGIFGATEPTLSTIVDDADSPPTTDDWHTDITWLADPPGEAVLTALEVPAHGGDTMWASTAAAYDALSDVMRSLIDGLEVVHSNWPEFCENVERKSGRSGVAERLRSQYPDVVHPLVRTHPASGRRSLYLSSPNTMKQVVGMTEAESDNLLTFLRRHLDQPRFHCRWHWSPSDVAIWDERTTNHRGVADHHPLRRVVRRCTADGERPFFRR